MITILMCTYNGDKYIRAQLDSILSQDRTDYRIIISDDGSTDDTINILNKYALAHSGKISVTIRTPASGSACRNFLMTMSEHADDSDYYMLCDQDDVWHPNKISIMMEGMKKAELRCGALIPLLVHSDSEIVDEELYPIAPSFVRYQKMTPSHDTINKLLVQNTVTGAACMYNRQLSTLITPPIGVIPDYAVMHDHWLALVATCFGRIEYVDKPTYKYRQHKANALGAMKGGMVREVMKRVGFVKNTSKVEMNEISRARYEALFKQAENFREIYGEKLMAGQIYMLDKFISLHGAGRWYKIKTICMCGFTRNTFYRTVGECLFI